MWKGAQGARGGGIDASRRAAVSIDGNGFNDTLVNYDNASG